MYLSGRYSDKNKLLVLHFLSPNVSFFDYVMSTEGFPCEVEAVGIILFRYDAFSHIKWNIKVTLVSIDRALHLSIFGSIKVRAYVRLRKKSTRSVNHIIFKRCRN